MNQPSALYLPTANVWNQKPAILMAVKTANDMGIFTLLSEKRSAVSWEELAALKNADIQLVGRYSY
jgi:hypothetical protein